MDPTLSAADEQANTRKERLRALSRSRLSRRSFLQAAGVAGIGAAGTALVGCGDDDDDEPAVAQTPAEQAPAEKTATVKVGVIAATSGVFLAFGQPQATATLMAIDQFNQAGGVVIGDTRYTMEAVERDSRSETSTAVAQANELINDMGVQYFFGPVMDPNAVAVQEITNPAKVIMMAGSTSLGQFLTDPADVAPGGAKRYLFKTQGSDFLQKRAFIQGVADFAPDDRRAISLHRNDALGQFMFPAVEQEFVDAGFDFLGIETFPEDTTDWSPILTRIREMDPEHIMFQWNGPVEVAAVQQAIELGVGNSYYLNLVDPAVILDTIGSTEQVIVSGCIPVCWGAPATPTIADFWDQYRVATGKEELGPAEGIAGLAFDAPFMLGEAWKAAGTVTDTDAVVAALENVSYDGLLGTIRFDETHTLLNGYEICKVQNGEITCNFYELQADGRMAATASSADA